MVCFADGFHKIDMLNKRVAESFGTAVSGLENHPVITMDILMKWQVKNLWLHSIDDSGNSLDKVTFRQSIYFGRR